MGGARNKIARPSAATESLKLQGSPAPSVSLLVLGMAVRENHLCTGDLHGAGVVGAREKLSVVGVRPGEKVRAVSL